MSALPRRPPHAARPCAPSRAPHPARSSARPPILPCALPYTLPYTLTYTFLCALLCALTSGPTLARPKRGARRVVAAAPQALAPPAQGATLSELSTLDLRDELCWGPSLLSTPTAIRAARRVAGAQGEREGALRARQSGAQGGGAGAGVAQAGLSARPLTAAERARGWREGDEEARAAWEGLASEAQRAWALAEERALGADWFERMGKGGPQPLSYTWPGGSTGFLLNAPPLEESPLWLVRRHTGYATPELLTGIRAGVYALRAAYPNSPRLVLGDLSARFGGRLPPHRSHQSGRDADIGYFMRGPRAHQLNNLANANAHTLDAPRTWAFLHGMLKTGLVESVYIDARLQRALYQQAQASGVPQAQLKAWFSHLGAKGALIIHLRGHSDHMHIRFKAPSSQAKGEALVREQGPGALKPRPRFGRARAGERLEQVARRYRVSVKTLSRWNRVSARAKLPKGRLLIVGYSPPWQLLARLRSQATREQGEAR